MLQAEILQFKYCRVLSKKPTKKVIESLTAIFDYIFIVGYSPWSNPYFKIIKKQSAVNQFSTNERPSIDPLYGDGNAGERIAKILSTVELRYDEKLNY